MRPFCFGVLVASGLLTLSPATAQLPVAKLNWIFPPGLSVGATNTLTVAGSDLDESVGLRFSDPRVTATALPGHADQFQVSVPAGLAPGRVEVRFAGRFGLSNPRPLALGTQPEFTTPATNTTAASASELPLETVVNSRVHPNTAAWFRFTATAGQRIGVRVEARELDSRLVPDLTVTDADGRELAVARRRQWLDFTAPTGGSFRLKLHDQTFRGGDDYHFRLRLTGVPRVAFAVPQVLRVGETNRVTLFGRGLPGGQPGPVNDVDGRPLDQVAVDVVAPPTASPLADVVELLRKPAAAALAAEAFVWRWPTTNGLADPLLFTLTTNAVVAAPGDGLVSVTPPAEFYGVFPARGRLSGVTFPARKGEVFWLELSSDRLGFPADPHAVVQRERTTKGDQGETLYSDVLELGDTDLNLGDREFNTSSRDAAARFEAPETATYRVVVRDQFNLGDGRPRYPYRLSVRRETPDFRLVALPLPPPRVGEDRQVQVLPLVARREQTIALRVLAFRRDGFAGDIELTATNLPSGVSANPARIAAGQTSGVLLLTASGEATGLSQAAVVGRAVVGSNQLATVSPLASVLWPVADYNNENPVARLHRDFPVAAVAAEWAPVTVVTAEAKPLTAVVEGKLAVPLRITRRGDFPAAFSLKPAGHPALDKAKEVAVAEKATNATFELNLAEAKLPIGTHTLWLQGSVSGKYRNNPEALAAAEAELKAADTALAVAATADKPKAEDRKKAAEAAKKSAEERAKPKDVAVMVFSQPFSVTVNPASKPEEKK